MSLKGEIAIKNYTQEKFSTSEAKGFYPLDNQILKMYSEGKRTEVEFGLYISSKENLQRTKGDLPRGQLYLSVSTVSTDLGISRAKAQRIIDYFKEKGIIKLIHKYENWEKKPSIWEIQSVSKTDIQNNIENDIQYDTQNHSKNNGLRLLSYTQNDTGSDTQDDTSKKENIKRKPKNYISSSKDEVLNKLAEEIWHLYPRKKGKVTAIKKLPILIKEYGYEQVKRTVKRYADECIGKEDQYIKHGSTFFNNGYLDYLDADYEETTNKEEVCNEWSCL